MNNLLYTGGTFTTGNLTGDTTFYVTESSCGYASAPAVVQLTSAVSPTVQASPANTIICIGNSISLSASGANSYTWTGNLQQSQVTVSPATNTTYVVTGSSPNGCKSSASVQVSVDQCLGLSGIRGTADARIFPNPANSMLTIETAADASFMLYAANGALVLRLEKMQQSRTIEISALPAGLYIGVLQSKENTSYHKIIKQD